MSGGGNPHQGERGATRKGIVTTSGIAVSKDGGRTGPVVNEGEGRAHGEERVAHEGVKAARQGGLGSHLGGGRPHEGGKCRHMRRRGETCEGGRAAT